MLAWRRQLRSALCHIEDARVRLALPCQRTLIRKTGLYLHGFDHALLWTLLGADPTARARLLASATAGGAHKEAALWINAAMTTTSSRTVTGLVPHSAATLLSDG